MDWIRRNWPDLLIGFALLAVISGIVATLLTGGSFFPLGGNGGQDTPRPSASQTQGTNQQNPLQPGTAQPAGSDQQQAQSGPAGGLADLPLLSTDPDSATAVDSLADDGPVDPFADLTDDPQDLPVVVAIRPGLDEVAQTAPAETGQAPASQQQTPASNPQQTDVQQPAQQPSAPATSQAGSSAGGQQVSSGQAPSNEVPYTVGVGAFRDADNAGRQAAIFRQAGYPVVVAGQDDLTVVLLGPYASRTEADRVLGQVTSGGFGVAPIVYTYQGEDGAAQQTSTSTAAADSSPQPPAAQTPAASPAPAETATAAGRYLQVGAFSSTENASSQAEVLQGLGYTVTQQQDGSLIRVLVGPYQDGQLDDARNRLAAQGIDSVPR